MTLEKFYETYKLHRQHSIGNPFFEDDASYIKDEFTRKYTSGPDSYEEHVGEFISIIENELLNDLSLCVEVSKSFNIDFFFWFTTEFSNEWFIDIIKKYKKIDLLNILKEHVYSFNNDIATERMDIIYDNSLKYCN